jgi:hypothetical protein
MLMDLREQIERAFDQTPMPAGILVDPLSDDEGVSNYFRGRSWRGHKVQDLRFHEVALSFFEPEAFRYYLPAFMLATLEDPAAADIIPHGILFHLSAPDDPRVWARLCAFAPGELDAVAAFVESLVGWCNDDECVSALETSERVRAWRLEDGGE